MAAITIRNIDDELKRALRRKGAENDRSMEEEARLAIQNWVRGKPPAPRGGLGSRLRKRFEASGGIELSAPERPMARPLPAFFDDE